MSDIKLNYSGQTGDLDLTSHQISLASGIDAIEQQLRIRLRMFTEEWFLDARVGIPYYRNILVKNPNLDLVRSIFRQAILTTPRVSSVSTIDATVNPSTRTLTLSFGAVLDTGEELVFSPFIIELG